MYAIKNFSVIILKCDSYIVLDWIILNQKNSKYQEEMIDKIGLSGKH